MTTKLTSRFDEALTLASELHRSQTRKGSDAPYISHLLRTAGFALEYGANENEAIAALLHDAVEDCGGLATLKKIADRFGEEVASIVLETSDSTSESPEKKAPWRERKERYVDGLRTCSTSAALISGCDKLDNVLSYIRSLDLTEDKEKFLSKFKVGLSEQIWYFESVLNILIERNMPIVKELREAIGRLKKSERYA